MKGKNVVYLVVALAIVAIVGLYYAASRNNRPPNTLKIGVVVPMTGDAATFGNNVRKGAELALDDAQKRGDLKGVSVQLINEDCKAEAKTGVAAMNKLTSVDGVVAVVDDCVSSVALAIVPIATKQQVPIVSAGATNPKLSGISKYFFRVWNSDTEEGAFSAQYITGKMGLKKAALLYINNDYGKGLQDVFSKEFANNGGTVVETETFDQGTSTFRSQLAKIKATFPDCLYLVGYSSDLPIILKQIAEAGIKAKIVGTVTVEDPVITKGAGKSAEGIIYPFPQAASGAVADSFKQAYKKKFGEDPGLASDTGYDAAAVILECIKQGARTGPEIQAALAKIKGFQGASGEFTFDSNGDVHKPMIMKTILGGKFVTVPVK